MTVDVDSIDLDEIAVMGARLSDGIYDVKMIDLQAGVSKKGAPYLKPTFEVISGPSKGLTHQGYYHLGTYKTQAGKVGCFGVMAIKRDAMALGVINKLPNPFPLDANKAKLAVHKAFKGAKMRIWVGDGQPDKEGKIHKECHILPGVTNTVEPDAEEEEIVY